jgi:hypothetical protein
MMNMPTTAAIDMKKVCLFGTAHTMPPAETLATIVSTSWNDR